MTFGSLLACASQDRTVTVWSARTGKALHVMRLRGHNSHLQAVTFTPDGRRLLSASRDGLVKRWDGTPGP